MNFAKPTLPLRRQPQLIHLGCQPLRGPETTQIPVDAGCGCGIGQVAVLGVDLSQLVQYIALTPQLVLLVIGFRAVEAAVGLDRRVNDCASPRGFAVARKLCAMPLPLVMVENDRAVLAWASGGGVVTLPEDGQEFFITNKGWVEVDLNGFGVVGETAISGVGLLAAGIAYPCSNNPVQTPVPGVRSPESAQGEGCRGDCRRDGLVKRRSRNLRFKSGCRHGAGLLGLVGVVWRTAGRLSAA